MYWWHQAAELARAGAIRRFGFITTNSLRQTFNRRVLERHLAAADPLSLLFAIPDHPWVDSADGAQVRIAMTVAEAGDLPGELNGVIAERAGRGEGLEVDLEQAEGHIHADLRIGANVASAVALSANRDLSNPGVKLHGAGFIVTPDEAAAMGLGRLPGLELHIRSYLNGRDLNQRPRGVMVIDLFGSGRGRCPVKISGSVPASLGEGESRSASRTSAKTGNNIGGFSGRPNPKLASLAGLKRYIATVETSKHRTFVFLDETILPDNKLINIALDDGWNLGILSSRVHGFWALAFLEPSRRR